MAVEALRLGRAVAAGEEFFFRHFGKLNQEETLRPARGSDRGPSIRATRRWWILSKSNPACLKQSRHWPSASGVPA